MSQVNLKPELVLNAINLNLNQHFFTETRGYAKNLFKSLNEGQRHPLMKFELGESGDVLCELELDTTEHVGKLNYGKFRRGLAMMILGIQNRLDAEADLTTLRSDSGELLFNIPGILKIDDDVNILVCSFRQLAPGLALIRLMYFEPNAYATAAGIDLNDIKPSDPSIILDDE